MPPHCIAMLAQAFGRVYAGRRQPTRQKVRGAANESADCGVCVRWCVVCPDARRAWSVSGAARGCAGVGGMIDEWGFSRKALQGNGDGASRRYLPPGSVSAAYVCALLVTMRPCGALEAIAF